VRVLKDIITRKLIPNCGLRNVFTHRRGAEDAEIMWDWGVRD
jgi:hypothetical protein